MEKNDSGSPLRAGKYVAIKNKSYFYPVEAQGRCIRTFLDIVQEVFQKPEKSPVGQGKKQNLTHKEKESMKKLSENCDIVI